MMLNHKNEPLSKVARHSFVDPRFLGTNWEIHGAMKTPWLQSTSHHIHPYFLVKLGGFAAGQNFLLLEVS